MEASSLTNLFYAVLAFGLVLIPAIIIHELGHLFAAKAVGINVLEFGVGFPPRLAKLFRWGETEFTLNWLPIGGFVRPLGEDMLGPVDEDAENSEKAKNDDGSIYITEREELMARGVPQDKLKSVNQATPLQRIFFMVAGAGANFISAILLFIIIALIGLTEVIGARAQVTFLDKQGTFANTSVAVGDAIEKINGQFFQTTDEALALWLGANGQPITLEMRGLESQEIYNVTVTPSANRIQPQVLVMGVTVDSPASQAGLLPGDAIYSIDGVVIPEGANPTTILAEQTSSKVSEKIALGVFRNGESIEFSLIPRKDPPPGQGRLGLTIMAQFATDDGLTLIGSNPQTASKPQSFGRAVEYGFGQFGFVINQIVSMPGQLINGKIDPELARPVSIVGISQIGGKFLQQSIQEGSPVIILNFLALISIFLGFTNLLPLPPLDGGRVVFVLIEMVRGKPVPISVETAIYKIGIILLLTLGGVVILLDLLRPIQIP